MTAPNNIADKLDEARVLIQKGWCQGSWSDGVGEVPVATSYCAVGAISQAKICDVDAALLSAEAAALARAIPVLRGELIDWNDAPERTHIEVIEAFRKAAELAREQSA